MQRVNVGDPHADGEALLLTERLVDVFGSETVAASTLLPVVKGTGERVVRCGRVELALAEDGSLWVTAVHAGVRHLGVHDGERWRWVGRRPISSPAMN